MNMNKVYNWFGGRSSAFALWFFVAGTILAFIDKLSVNYIAMAGALQTIITTRSIADDYHTRQVNGNGNGHVIEGPQGPQGLPGGEPK